MKTITTLYSTTSCMKCKLLSKKMDAYGIEYKTILLDENPEIMEVVKRAGFMSVPVIHHQIWDEEWVEDVFIEDFRPDLLQEIVTAA